MILAPVGKRGITRKESIMRRLENGRIAIQGTRPDPQTRRRNNIERLFRDTYSENVFSVKIHGLQSEFRNNAFFSAAVITDAPRKNRNVTKVNIEKTWYSGRRGQSAVKITRPATVPAGLDALKDATIEFRITGKKSLRGLFYVNAKTLCVANVNNPDTFCFARAVISYLKGNGYLFETVTPVDEALSYINTTVGCDPEFEAMRNGRVVHACEFNDVFGGTGENVELGRDGAGAQIEIRPRPSTDPLVVVENIKRIMGRIPCEISCKGTVYPLGGHIHVGVGHSYEIPDDLKVILDSFIGKTTIDLSGSARSSYKALGQSRAQAWGFEYRSTPTACFWKPEFALLCMKIVKNLTEKFINAGRFEFNASPTREDYVTNASLTDDEADLFFANIRDYEYWMLQSSDPLDIRGNWIENPVQEIRTEPTPEAPVVPTTSSRIVFADEWSPDVRAFFRFRLPRNLQTRSFGLGAFGLGAHRGQATFGYNAPGCTPRNLQTRLFGLGAHRGQVTFGYNAPGCTRIETAPVGSTWSGYGVPYSIRVMNINHLDFEIILQSHVDAIVADSQGRT